MLDELLKTDKELMRLLKVDSVGHYVAETYKGVLRLVLRKEEEQHFFTLDAVPLEKELNDRLIRLLYPKDSFDFVEKKDLYPNLADINVRFGLLEKKLNDHENIQSEQKGDVSGTQAYNPGIKESRLEVGSSTASEGTKAN